MLPTAPNLPPPTPTAPKPTPIMPIPTVTPPPASTPTASPPVPSHTLDVREGELRLPTIKPGNVSPAPTPKATESNTPEIKKLSSAAPEPTPNPTPLPTVKSNRPAMSWESENAGSSSSPRIITVTPPEEKTSGNSHDETPKIKKGKTHKPDTFASDSAAPTHSSAAPTHSDGSADAMTAPSLPMTWRRPGSSESSEPPAKATPKTTPPAPTAPKAPATPAPYITGVTGASFERMPTPTAAPTPPPTPAAAPASTPATAPASRTVKRWPPAYDVRPPESEAGHAGTIEFEEEPPAEPAKTPAATPAPTAARTTTQDLLHPVVPEDLKKQVKAACGRHVRDVTVEVQLDGTVSVSIKVTRSAEKQVTSKILSIPEMSSPKVRLKMDVVP
jgi:hypothetical protein